MLRVIFGHEQVEGICDEMDDEEFDRLHDLAKRGYIKCWLAFRIEGKPVHVNILDVHKTDLPQAIRSKILPEDEHLVPVIHDVLNGRR
jgi:hypothetical protein